MYYTSLQIFIYFLFLGVATNGANSIPDRNRKNSSFRSKTISDLLACCAHVTASIRMFPPCFLNQMPFLLLFLQPILRIYSSTFSSFFVHPLPLISQYFLCFFVNLPLQFLAIIQFCQVLSSQELMYQNSNLDCWQTLIKTGFQSFLDLLKVQVFCVKLESSCCRIHCAIRSGSIDQELDSTDRKSSRMFFSA